MLDQIYKELRERGLVRSKRAFSRSFLGRAHNYATSERTRARPSTDVLLHLARRLTDEGATDLANGILHNLLGQSGPMASDGSSLY